LLKWAEELGTQVAWNVLVRAPGEKDEWYAEMAEYLPLLHHLQPPSAIVSIRVDRFSPYHRNPEEYGLKLTPYKIYSQIYPKGTDIEGIAYYFEQVGTPLLFSVE